MKLAAIAALAVLVTACDAKTPAPYPAMVALADGRVLFGTFQDKDKNPTLCNYAALVREKKGVRLQKPSAQFGGTGCVTLREQILTVEPLDTTSQIAKALK